MSVVELDVFTNDVLYLIYVIFGGFIRFFIAGIWAFSIAMFLVELARMMER